MKVDVNTLYDSIKLYCVKQNYNVKPDVTIKQLVNLLETHNKTLFVSGSNVHIIPTKYSTDTVYYINIKKNIVDGCLN